MVLKGEKVEERWDNRNDQGRDKDEITRRYFDLLTQEEIDALYSIYKTDLQMFGYKWEFRGKRYS